MTDATHEREPSPAELFERFFGPSIFVPWTDVPLFQHWGVGLSQRDLDPPLPPNWSHVDAESWIGISADDSRVRMAGLDDRYRIPLPDSTGAWRRYALQISGSGEQVLLVDGRVHVRAHRPPGWVPGDSARIILSGQAIRTAILHGPLTVFEGELYDRVPGR